MIEIFPSVQVVKQTKIALHQHVLSTDDSQFMKVIESFSIEIHGF